MATTMWLEVYVQINIFFLQSKPNTCIAYMYDVGYSVCYSYLIDYLLTLAQKFGLIAFVVFQKCSWVMRK